LANSQVSVIGNEVAAALGGIANQVWWTKQYWEIYKSMSCNDEYVKILTVVGPHFFGAVQSMLPDYVKLSVMRLLDPAMTGGKPNLTFAGIIGLLAPSLNNGDKKLDAIKLRLHDLETRVKPWRVHRNKRLAHLDLPTHINAVRLPDLRIEEYDHVVAEMCAILSELYVATEGRSLYVQDEGSPAVSELINNLSTPVIN
jgi:hypothetical protein